MAHSRPGARTAEDAELLACDPLRSDSIRPPRVGSVPRETLQWLAMMSHVAKPPPVPPPQDGIAARAGFDADSNSRRRGTNRKGGRLACQYLRSCVSSPAFGRAGTRCTASEATGLNRLPLRSVVHRPILSVSITVLPVRRSQR